MNKKGSFFGIFIMLLGIFLIALSFFPGMDFSATPQIPNVNNGGSFLLMGTIGFIIGFLMWWSHRYDRLLVSYAR